MAGAWTDLIGQDIVLNDVISPIDPQYVDVVKRVAAAVPNAIAYVATKGGTLISIHTEGKDKPDVIGHVNQTDTSWARVVDVDRIWEHAHGVAASNVEANAWTFYSNGTTGSMRTGSSAAGSHESIVANGYMLGDKAAYLTAVLAKAKLTWADFRSTVLVDLTAHGYGTWDVNVANLEPMLFTPDKCAGFVDVVLAALGLTRKKTHPMVVIGNVRAGETPAFVDAQNIAIYLGTTVGQQRFVSVAIEDVGAPMGFHLDYAMVVSMFWDWRYGPLSELAARGFTGKIQVRSPGTQGVDCSWYPSSTNALTKAYYSSPAAVEQRTWAKTAGNIKPTPSVDGAFGYGMVLIDPLATQASIFLSQLVNVKFLPFIGVPNISLRNLQGVPTIKSGVVNTNFGNLTIIRVDLSKVDELVAVDKTWYKSYLTTGWGGFAGASAAKLEASLATWPEALTDQLAAVRYFQGVTVPPDPIDKLDVRIKYKKAKEKACRRDDFYEQTYCGPLKWQDVKLLCDEHAQPVRAFYCKRSSAQFAEQSFFSAADWESKTIGYVAATGTNPVTPGYIWVGAASPQNALDGESAVEAFANGATLQGNVLAGLQALGYVLSDEIADLNAARADYFAARSEFTQKAGSGQDTYLFDQTSVSKNGFVDYKNMPLQAALKGYIASVGLYEPIGDSVLKILDSYQDIVDKMKPVEESPPVFLKSEVPAPVPTP